jgi:hypothetical protein
VAQHRELNTAQLEPWQRTIEVVTEDGRRRQMWSFADRHRDRADWEELVVDDWLTFRWRKSLLGSSSSIAAQVTQMIERNQPEAFQSWTSNLFL